MKPFDRQVLMCVRDLGGDAYGRTVSEELARRGVKSPGTSVVYTVLWRLEDLNLVTTSLGEVSTEEGTRHRRFYCVTRLGEQELENPR